MIFGFEGDAFKTAFSVLRSWFFVLNVGRFWLGQVVKIAKPGVGHGPVGIEKDLHGQVFREHFPEKLYRLSPHACFEPRIVIGVELFVRRERPDPVQLQPLPGEVVDEAVDPRVG